MVYSGKSLENICVVLVKKFGKVNHTSNFPLIYFCSFWNRLTAISYTHIVVIFFKFKCPERLYSPFKIARNVLRNNISDLCLAAT